jgi:hypothetical protein
MLLGLPREWTLHALFLPSPGGSAGRSLGTRLTMGPGTHHRDNALPGSRWWKKITPRTSVPVNAVWLVMILSGILGVLGFSVTALTSLAGYEVILFVRPTQLLTNS